MGLRLEAAAATGRPSAPRPEQQEEELCPLRLRATSQRGEIIIIAPRPRARAAAEAK